MELKFDVNTIKNKVKNLKKRYIYRRSYNFFSDGSLSEVFQKRG